MIRWLGHDRAADGLMKCIGNVRECGIKTKELGGSASTTEVTEAVCDEIEIVLGQAG